MTDSEELVNPEFISTGSEMHSWARDMYFYPRSITGPGVRQTLDYLKRLVPEIKSLAFKSGEQIYDWVVPKEWVVKEAWVKNEAGEKLLDFRDDPLQLVGYSEPVDEKLSLGELNSRIHSLPELPDAIPYVTSYYSRTWGFCMPDSQRKTLEDGEYHVKIRSEFRDSYMDYGELVLKGESEDEILLTTYICHPSMANNELSGPVVAIAMARWLKTLPQRRFTYRILFLPETVGSIAYISHNLEHLKAKTKAAFVLTCLGDERKYSFLASRRGNTLADRVATKALDDFVGEYDTYSWSERGSDERQFGAPGVDLPVASIMRSKYATYPEYHTSLDNLEFVTPAGLAGGFAILREAVSILEQNFTLKNTFLCEPQLSKRDLYPTVSSRGHEKSAKPILNVLSLCDGNMSLLEISENLKMPFREVSEIAELLLREQLVYKYEQG